MAKIKETEEKKDVIVDPMKNDETKNTAEENKAPTIDPVKNDEKPVLIVIESDKEEVKYVEKKVPSKEFTYLDFDANEVSFKGMTEAEKLIKVMNTKFDKKTLDVIIQTEFKDDDKVTDEITELIESHIKYKMFYQKFN